MLANGISELYKWQRHCSSEISVSQMRWSWIWWGRNFQTKITRVGLYKWHLICQLQVAYHWSSSKISFNFLRHCVTLQTGFFVTDLNDKDSQGPVFFHFCVYTSLVCPMRLTILPFQVYAVFCGAYCTVATFCAVRCWFILKLFGWR
jgi:hypothetical protein